MEIFVNGRELTIPALKVKHLPIVVKHALPLIKAVESVGIVEAIAANIDHLIALVVELGVVDREWLEEQEPAVLLDILQALLEVNADFFIQAGASATQGQADR